MSSVNPGPPATQKPPTLRLRYLDGLRGMAMTLVVLHHLYLQLMDPRGTGRLAYGMPSAVQLGRVALDLFIVMSGYSLMIPVARSGDGRLPGGWKRYVRRRARRILPPYYVALLATTVTFVPLLTARPGPRIPIPFSAGSFVAHVLLVHNLSPVWARQISGPLWSLATEWQIYFGFPLLLLPLWRSVGGVVTVTVATALGLAVARVAPFPLAQASPWYFGLFAMGMTAAGISLSPHPPERLRRIAWAWVGALAFAATAGVGMGWPDELPLFDVLCGIALAALLIDQTERARASAGGAARPGKWSRTSAALLESRGPVWLGVISYSLYLVHQPLITLLDTLAVQRTHWSFPLRVGLEMALVPAAVLGVAVVFHHTVERPFMPGRPVTPVQAARSAALEPAV